MIPRGEDASGGRVRRAPPATTSNGDGDPKADSLEQLSEYLDRLGLDEGALVLFDQRSDAPSISERCSRSEEVYGGRRITVLRL